MCNKQKFWKYICSWWERKKLVDDSHNEKIWYRWSGFFLFEKMRSCRLLQPFQCINVSKRLQRTFAFDEDLFLLMRKMLYKWLCYWLLWMLDDDSDERKRNHLTFGFLVLFVSFHQLGYWLTFLLYSLQFLALICQNFTLLDDQLLQSINFLSVLWKRNPIIHSLLTYNSLPILF